MKHSFFQWKWKRYSCHDLEYYTVCWRVQYLKRSQKHIYKTFRLWLINEVRGVRGSTLRNTSVFALASSSFLGTIGRTMFDLALQRIKGGLRGWTRQWNFAIDFSKARISPPVNALCNQKNVPHLGTVTKDRIERIKFLQLSNQMSRRTKVKSRCETIRIAYGYE